MAGRRVTWKWGNQTHSGTLIPSMETKSARFARTKNGKIVELAVKNIIEGNKIKNIEALANPEVLNQYKDLKELNY